MLSKAPVFTGSTIVNGSTFIRSTVATPCSDFRCWFKKVCCLTVLFILVVNLSSHHRATIVARTKQKKDVSCYVGNCDQFIWPSLFLSSWFGCKVIVSLIIGCPCCDYSHLHCIFTAQSVSLVIPRFFWRRGQFSLWFGVAFRKINL